MFGPSTGNARNPVLGLPAGATSLDMATVLTLCTLQRALGHRLIAGRVVGEAELATARAVNHEALEQRFAMMKDSILRNTKGKSDAGALALARSMGLDL